MLALIRKAGGELIRKHVTDIADLTGAVYASLVEHLERTGRLRIRPFDAAACPGATFDDLSPTFVISSSHAPSRSVDTSSVPVRR